MDPASHGAFRELQHAVEIAVQFEPAHLAAARVAGMDHHGFDQRPDRLARGARFPGCEMGFELGDGAAVYGLVIGWEADDGTLGKVSEFVDQTRFLGLEFLEARAERPGSVVVLLDPLQDLGAAGARVAKRCFDLVAAAVGGALLGVELALEMDRKAADYLGCKQAIAQAGEGACLQLVAGN